MYHHIPRLPSWIKFLIGTLCLFIQSCRCYRHTILSIADNMPVTHTWNLCKQTFSFIWICQQALMIWRNSLEMWRWVQVWNHECWRLFSQMKESWSSWQWGCCCFHRPCCCCYGAAVHQSAENKCEGKNIACNTYLLCESSAAKSRAYLYP